MCICFTPGGRAAQGKIRAGIRVTSVFPPCHPLWAGHDRRPSGRLCRSTCRASATRTRPATCTRGVAFFRPWGARGCRPRSDKRPACRLLLFLCRRSGWGADPGEREQVGEQFPERILVELPGLLLVVLVEDRSRRGEQFLGRQLAVLVRVRAGEDRGGQEAAERESARRAAV